MKRLVVLTGAGISAESGLSTFRDSDGLWDNYDVMEVASAQGFAQNPELVHQFYNTRRKELLEKQPNDAHRGLVELEQRYDVQIITQNVDNLHELAGSKNVLHLHGELMKVRSMTHPDRIYTLPCNNLTDKGLTTSPNTRDNYGDAVRPHIVFFGEDVPNYATALQLTMQAHILVVIGTSLNVTPASLLLHYAPPSAKVFYIDPRPAQVPPHVQVIAEKATTGVANLLKML